MSARAVLIGQRGARAAFSVLASLGRARQRPPATPADRATALAETFRELCDVHQLRVAVHGPLPPMPSLMVANHLSYLDPVIILANASGVPICKQSVGRWPIIGTGARVLGVLLVDRDNMMDRATVLRRAIRTMKTGVRVLNFPEGTTTDGNGEMMPFHRGMFGAARIAGVPIVPVALRFESVDLTWTGNQYFLPHYLATAARPSSSIRIDWGEPISPWAEPTAEALAQRARHAIKNLLQRGLHEPRERVRLPATRPDPVFSPAIRQAR